MDWEFVFMVTLGWVVSGGLMYLIYVLGKSLCRDAFSGKEEDNQPGIPLWRQWLNGVGAVGVRFPIFGFFFRLPWGKRRVLGSHPRNFLCRRDCLFRRLA